VRFTLAHIASLTRAFYARSYYWFSLCVFDDRSYYWINLCDNSLERHLNPEE
jgi:hypothetical protein